MSAEKIPSLRKSVLLTLLMLVGVPIFWFIFLDIKMVGMSEEMTRKCSQIGMYLNLASALSMVVRYLWLNGYNKRLEDIYKLDTSAVRHHEHSKHYIYDERNAKIAEDDLKSKQEPLYQEISHYNKFEKVETIHFYMGIAGLTVGTYLQILAAGRVVS